MDYESKILLNNLIDAVNRTDWWVVGITILNAAIMVWLGWNQYKLQKRQTEAQEYEIYRKLYRLLGNANREIDEFIHNIWIFLWEPYYNSDKDFFNRKQTYIEQLRKDLTESYIDYELKFSKKTFNRIGYMQVLTLMLSLLRVIISSLENGNVQLSVGARGVDYEQGKEDYAYASFVAGQFTDKRLQIVLMQNFEAFIRQKNAVRCDDSVLEKIRKKCKID